MVQAVMTDGSSIKEQDGKRPKNQKTGGTDKNNTNSKK